jgi:hypothetical protein
LPANHCANLSNTQSEGNTYFPYSPCLPAPPPDLRGYEGFIVVISAQVYRGINCVCVVKIWRSKAASCHDRDPCHTSAESSEMFLELQHQRHQRSVHHFESHLRHLHVHENSPSLLTIMAAILSNVYKWAIPLTVAGSLAQASIYDVKGGTRAVIFDRLGGVKDTVVNEGTHFLIPWLQKSIIYDVRTKPRNISTTTGSKDLQMVSLTLRVLHRPEVQALPKIYQVCLFLPLYIRCVKF